ncbi:MAG: FAD-dependent oxidoreductase [Pseudomonadota bacterium]
MRATLRRRSLVTPIFVIGRGVVGLWQALTLAERGHPVTLVAARSDADSTGADEHGAKCTVGRTAENKPASWYAGGMLAPGCEGETAEPIVARLGARSIAIWPKYYPDVQSEGSLVVAHARDRGELARFHRQTDGAEPIDADRLAKLEPDLDGRFRSGLFFPTEAHVNPRAALEFLSATLAEQGVETVDIDPADADRDDLGGLTSTAPDARTLIDCRGMGARAALPALRGVRGEMAVLHAPDVSLSRPVRLLHPRFPLYIVPWGDHRYMVGATVIEREDAGPVTARAALELLGHAYALHPAFAEARIEQLGAGIRPAFADNAPAIVATPGRAYINGVFRHGFLTAPALAEHMADYLETNAMDPEVFRAGDDQR